MGSIQAGIDDYDPAKIKKLRPRCILGTVQGLVNVVEGWCITPYKQKNLGVVAYVRYFFRNAAQYSVSSREFGISLHSTTLGIWHAFIPPRDSTTNSLVYLPSISLLPPHVFSR